MEGLGLAKRFLLFCTGLTILEPRPNYSGMIGNGPMLTWSYLSQFVTYLTDFADLELFIILFLTMRSILKNFKIDFYDILTFKLLFI